MTFTDTMIPVYSLSTCSNGKNFVIWRMEKEDIPLIATPHRHDSYSINLLLSGRVTVYIDFEKHDVEGPAIISMGPQQVHQYENVEDCDMILLSFGQDFLFNEMQGWMACWECMFGHVVMAIDDASKEQLHTYARLMMNEYTIERPQQEGILRNLLSAFIMSCGRLRDKSDVVMQMDLGQNKLVYQFKWQVDINFREKTQVSQYADMLYVTPGHLNDVIKSTVGKTAKQVIDEKRVLEAKRLLFWGTHNMKEIAWQLNFEDDAYFNRFFKKHTGLTPSFFQRTIREKYN
jgi:AraC-like DNA-binding protein